LRGESDVGNKYAYFIYRQDYSGGTGHNCQRRPQQQPLVSEIVAASEKVPLLAFFLRLDMAIVREILAREEFKTRDGNPQVPATAKRGAICCSPVFVSWIYWILLRTSPSSVI
jgi:hypothetical protein